ncbi:MAG: glycosyltransferase [Nitrososphaerota archaeon]
MKASQGGMKVLHITHLYPRPYDRLIGIAMHKQIKALEALGCTQKVISPTPWTPFPIKYLSHKWRSYSQVPIRDVIEGIQVYYPRYLEFPRSLFLASSGIRVHQGIMKLVKKIEREFSFDLIHAHMALPDGYASMLISMEYQRPMVVTFRATDLDITAKGSKDFLRT